MTCSPNDIPEIVFESILAAGVAILIVLFFAALLGFGSSE